MRPALAPRRGAAERAASSVPVANAMPVIQVRIVPCVPPPLRCQSEFHAQAWIAWKDAPDSLTSRSGRSDPRRGLRGRCKTLHALVAILSRRARPGESTLTACVSCLLDERPSCWRASGLRFSPAAPLGDPCCIPTRSSTASVRRWRTRTLTTAYNARGPTVPHKVTRRMWRGVPRSERGPVPRSVRLAARSPETLAAVRPSALPPVEPQDSSPVFSDRESPIRSLPRSSTAVCANAAMIRSVGTKGIPPRAYGETLTISEH